VATNHAPETAPETVLDRQRSLKPAGLATALTAAASVETPAG